LSDLQTEFLSGAGLISVLSGKSVLSNLTGTNEVSTDPAMLTQLQQGLLGAFKLSIAQPLATGTPLESNSAVANAISDDESSSVRSSAFTFVFGDDGLEQNDLFDSINVLNHIPLIGDYYQTVNDTNISNASKLAGGFIYGGPTGLALSAAEVGVNYFSGYQMKDFASAFGFVPDTSASTSANSTSVNSALSNVIGTSFGVIN
jgi:hypothetical protein